jgi:GT2 family glycosyltransferase
MQQTETHPSSIAVLMTCHNRRELTLACLSALYRQTALTDSVHSIPANVDVYLVDDGSTDGTTDAIRQTYPAVKLIPGDGNLFWVGGMRQAFAAAMQHTHSGRSGYDYYLWLNDDTWLESDALQRLLLAHQDLMTRNQTAAIVVGSTYDRRTQTPTYGGARRSRSWYSNKFEFVGSTQELQECDTFYGNCVLIARSVVDRIGNIDDAFVHNLGDLDYGLRATRAGASVWVMPGFIGTCSQNSVRGSWADTQLSLGQRLRKVTQLKGFPLGPWTIFCQRHSGPFWFLYWFLPYLRAMIGYRNLDASPSFCAADPE